MLLAEIIISAVLIVAFFLAMAFAEPRTPPRGEA
jgi:hypothetical protein